MLEPWSRPDDGFLAGFASASSALARFCGCDRVEFGSADRPRIIEPLRTAIGQVR